MNYWAAAMIFTGALISQVAFSERSCTEINQNVMAPEGTPGTKTEQCCVQVTGHGDRCNEYRSVTMCESGIYDENTRGCKN